ncbi:MAG: thiamine diphosphokinase [Bacteroidales bacterium]|nr:thiamine diphosphokinase [Bacteroidales bacterium]
METGGGSVAVIAAGDFPTHQRPLQALKEASYVVFCDSAYSEVRLGCLGTTDYDVVGDGDSLPEAVQTKLGNKFHKIDEQDFNDLHKAVAFAFEKHPTARVCRIFGATGRREDHTLGNISYLPLLAAEHREAVFEMLTDYGIFTTMTGHRCYRSFARQQVSVFSLDPHLPISGSGLKWQLNETFVDSWWQATLNEALADSFTLQSRGRLIVFQTYDPK